MKTSTKMKKLSDEIKALKSAQPINAGNLTQNAETESLTFTVRTDEYWSGAKIRGIFEATYTRTDDILKPPLVQFAYSLNPDDNFDSNSSAGIPFAVGSNSVSYRIILSTNWWPFYSSTVGTSILTCTAYSTVPGVLSLRRVE